MKKLSLFNSAAVTALALACSAGTAAPFSPGTLVVVRVGDGSAALTATAAATFLEERSPLDGALIQIVPLPVAAAGAHAACTLTGNAASEGFLTISPSNQYLMLGGYAAIPGVASPAQADAASIARVVARVDMSAAINTTTQLADAFSGTSGNNANIRSAITDNGADIWIAGTAPPAQVATAGFRITTLGGSASTQLASSPTNVRVLNIFFGQLYGGSGSSPFTNVSTIGTGLPTSAGQTVTSLVGMPTTGASNYDYFFANSSTLYVADDGGSATSGGVQKWVFDGAQWTSPYKYLLGASGTARGLTGKVSGGDATLWVTSNAGTNAIWTVLDTIASGSPGAAPVMLVNGQASTNTAFRGLRVLPGTFGGVADGACCMPDGTCTVATSAGCTASGGVYQGNFSDCGSVNCPQPGSCCLPSGACLILSSGQCSTQGGTYGGNGTSCDTANCGPRSGACCAANGTCSVVTQASCVGTYRGDGTSCATAGCGDFDANNLVVLEAGDGANPVAANTATPMFLREIRISDGATLQVIGLPTLRTEAGNRSVTLNATSTTEGSLSRSENGQYLTYAAYNLDGGATGPAGSITSRVVARISGSGVVNTTTAFTDNTFLGSSPRGAASVDGTAFWLTGDAPDIANRGVRYALFGGNSSIQINDTTPTNNRCINIFDGNLYISSGSTPVGVSQVGTGLPTTSGQFITNKTANLDPMDFFFADSNTLYTGSRGGGTGNNGITKYTFDGQDWLLAYVLDEGGLVTVPVQHITGKVNGGTVTLYGTTGETQGGSALAGNRLVAVIDNGGSSPYTTIATAPANKIWKGVEFAPAASGPVTCYANCDNSTNPPVLNVADFTCFLQRFAAGEDYANCDNSTNPPVLNVADFTCFLQQFAAGCP